MARNGSYRTKSLSKLLLTNQAQRNHSFFFFFQPPAALHGARVSELHPIYYYRDLLRPTLLYPSTPYSYLLRASPSRSCWREVNRNVIPQVPFHGGPLQEAVPGTTFRKFCQYASVAIYSMLTHGMLLSPFRTQGTSQERNSKAMHPAISGGPSPATARPTPSSSRTWPRFAACWAPPRA